MIYSFENFELDTHRIELRKGHDVLPVEPQVLSLLELLISNHDRVVSKDEINQVVWGGRIVSEAALSSRIKLARKIIGDDGSQQRLIRTIHNRGFRFVVVPKIESTVPAQCWSDPSRDPGTASTVLTSSDTSVSGTEERSYIRDRPTVAVLPFDELGNNEQSTGFAKAVSHELILELSRLRWLYVIARGSSFRFQSSNLDLATIRRSLGVDYLLSGTVEVLGHKSFVTVEMSCARNGRIIWADRYQGAAEDLIALRQTVASQVVSSIEIRVPLEEATRTADLPTENLDAWSAYHRGLSHMYRFNKHDNSVATSLFEHAVRADPNFARAYAGLSFTHFQNSFLHFVPDQKAERDLSLKLAEKSLELDPLDPFINLTMGRSHMLSGDIEGSISWFDRSIDLSPSYAFAKYNRGLAQVVTSNGVASEEDTSSALLLSPLDPLKYAMLATRGMSHMVRGDYAEASVWCERAANAPNSHLHIHAIAALAHYLAENHDKAGKWAAKVMPVKQGNYLAQFLRCFPFRDVKVVANIEEVFRKLSL